MIEHCCPSVSVRAKPGWKMMRLHSVNTVRRTSPSLAENTTVGTVEISTVTVVLLMSWPCPPTLDLYGSVTAATPYCCRGAPLPPPLDTHKQTLIHTLLLPQADTHSIFLLSSHCSDLGNCAQSPQYSWSLRTHFNPIWAGDLVWSIKFCFTTYLKFRIFGHGWLLNCRGFYPLLELILPSLF